MIENDQILVKQFNTATCLIYIFEIYDLKTKQKICRYECEKNIDNDFLFLEENYLLRVNKNGLNAFNISNLKNSGNIINIFNVGNNQRKWAVFRDNSGLNFFMTINYIESKDVKLNLLLK